MTKDGIPFCLGSINLIDRTTAAQSPFNSIADTVPELQIKNGILSISLNWSDIQRLNCKLNQLLIVVLNYVAYHVSIPLLHAFASVWCHLYLILCKRKMEDCMPRDLFLSFLIYACKYIFATVNSFIWIMTLTIVENEMVSLLYCVFLSPPYL